MEAIVRKLVQRSPLPRGNPVKREDILDLSQSAPPKRHRDCQATRDDLRISRQRVERGFIDIASPRARSVVTCSTTDAHVGPSMNPRNRAV
mmetsp:Transcript_30541/g.47650  ORF Transcript_30541/g.47650 Transcript_30541/m.47650 type:complete len:91 (+) Transcript_30541:2-274(+)